jgi:large subunit ribosomal protein L6
MSRIGRKPIIVPPGVKIEREGETIRVKGPKGELEKKLPPLVDVELAQDVLTVKRLSEDRFGRSYHGLARTLINNMVEGVTKGYEKALEISGVGYRAELAGDRELKLILGFSTPVSYRIPEGISIKVDRQVNISVSGIDKELVGRVAAEIRALKKPEPYKGKGVRYAGEVVRRKAGKSVGSK